jgi:hypothetical protein
MTQAQKTAKAKFKQAIAYRQKTGVSLKEAFAHIYGKKVGAVKKKSAPKKKAAKKVAKKVVKKKYGLNPKKDKLYEAKKPGKRIAKKSGKTYYESRENRSDKGKVYGIVKAKPTIISLAKKIANLTDRNEHNLSILLLAKFLKSKKAIELMNNVIKMHDNFGYMPKNLIDIREEIYSTLMMLLKSKYGEVDYKTIQNSF